MSMLPRVLAEIPEQTAAVARAAFREPSLAMRVRDELGEVFADGAFIDAFGIRGRPGISPGQLAMVTVLQFAENLTDRQAADAVRGRIDWKYCLGLDLIDSGFDFSVLSQFRTRLVIHDLQGMAFEILLDRLVERGLVTVRGRQRTEATHVVAAVRDLNRLEMVGETLIGQQGRAGAETSSVLVSATRHPGEITDVVPCPSARCGGDLLDDARDGDLGWVRVIAGERAPAGLIALVCGAGVSGWPDSVSAQLRRAGRPAMGAGRPMFPATANSVDGVCRVRTVSGLGRQRGLAPGPARVW
jgi:transposase